MILTKLLTDQGNFEYVNLEQITEIDVNGTKYEVQFSDGVTIKADITDTTITALVSAADSAYTAPV